VLQINVKTLALMRMQKHISAGGGTFVKDYQTLNFILESHYLQKNDWRARNGLFSAQKDNTSMPPIIHVT
jgi:hypothetical protein